MDGQNTRGLFSLPRELRDAIYEELITASAPVRVTRKYSPELRARAHHIPAPSLLLISHQFSEEYRSVVAKKTILVVADHFDMSGHKQRHAIRLSRCASRIETVKLDIYIGPDSSIVRCEADKAGCCMLGEDMEWHMRWIPDLLAQLPQLKSTSIRVHTPYAPSTTQKQVPNTYSKHLIALTTLPRLEDMTFFVNRGVSGVKVQAWDYARPGKRAFLRWERATGKFRQVEDGKDEAPEG